MKKMSIVALLAVSMAVGAAASVQAQEKKSSGKASAAASAKADESAGGGDDNTQYKAKTVYDFEDDMVEGDLQRPDGELIDSVRKSKHSSLIEIRKDFIPEMLKSLEDV